MDDGSLDNTRLVAKEYGADEVIVFARTKGKGQAIRSGFLAASGLVTVVMDADGSYDPKKLPEMIVPILKSDADLVIG